MPGLRWVALAVCQMMIVVCGFVAGPLQTKILDDLGAVDRASVADGRVLSTSSREVRRITDDVGTVVDKLAGKKRGPMDTRCLPKDVSQAIIRIYQAAGLLGADQLDSLFYKRESSFTLFPALKETESIIHRSTKLLQSAAVKLSSLLQMSQVQLQQELIVGDAEAAERASVRSGKPLKQSTPEWQHLSRNVDRVVSSLVAQEELQIHDHCGPAKEVQGQMSTVKGMLEFAMKKVESIDAELERIPTQTLHTIYLTLNQAWTVVARVLPPRFALLLQTNPAALPKLPKAAGAKPLFAPGDEGLPCWRSPALLHINHKVLGHRLFAFAEGWSTIGGRCAPDTNGLDGFNRFEPLQLRAIYMRMSTDGGHTWSRRQHIVGGDSPSSNAFKNGPASSPAVVFDERTGCIVLMFGADFGNCCSKWTPVAQTWSTKSCDLQVGKIWNKPTNIDAAFGKYTGMTPQPGYGIQISTGPSKGRLMFAAKHKKANPLGENQLPSQSQQTVIVLYSDDGGTTWTPSLVQEDGTPVLGSFEKSELVELSHGSVLVTLPKTGPRSSALSSDGGQSFTFVNVGTKGIPQYGHGPRYSGDGGVTTPVLRLQDGRLVLATPVTPTGRQAITLFINSNDGELESWKHSQNVHRGSSGDSSLVEMPVEWRLDSSQVTVGIAFESDYDGCRGAESKCAVWWKLAELDKYQPSAPQGTRAPQTAAKPPN